MMVTIALTIVVIIIVTSVNGQNRCTTHRTGGSGYCVALKQCKSLSSVLAQSLLSEDDIELLNGSKCVADNGAEHVCCEVDDVDDIEPVSVSTMAADQVMAMEPVTEPELSQRFQGSTDCRTPTNTNGKCISLQQCPSLLSLLAIKPLTTENRMLLQKSQCGYVNRVVHVCCSTVVANTVTRSDAMKLLPDLKTCGATTNDRIVGGERTKIDEFPWLVLIQYSDGKTGKLSFNCGGTLINKRYVLSAAHCVATKNRIPDRYKPVSVRLGEWDLSTDRDCEKSNNGDEDCVDIPVQDIPIELTIPYPSYNIDDKTVKNDISLIRLAHEPSYNYFVKPICLPITEKLRTVNLDGISLTVAGWGRTENTSKSNIKLKVNLNGVALEKCRSVFPKQDIWSKQICAGGVAGKDSCSGDSGGPLMKEAMDGRVQFFVIAGIVSYGTTPCGQTDRPGVYTRVADYVDWILDTIRP